jgi:hypothetical protein
VFAIKRFLVIFPYRLVTYAVERKQVSKHRQLIMLAPMRSFNGPISATLAYFFLEGHQIERFNPIVKNKDGRLYARFKTCSDTPRITTALVNTNVSATADCVDDDCIAIISRLGSTKLMLPSTNTWLKDNRHASAVLTEYHREASGAKVPVVFPVHLGVRTYTFEPESFNPDDKTKLEAFMSPIIHGAFVPSNNASNERQAIKGRVTDLKRPEPQRTQFFNTCLKEFTKLLVDGTILHPEPIDTIVESQTSPQQRTSIARAILYGPFRKFALKCFVKAEAYLGVKDPRIISTYNDACKLDMACYAYALAQHCKQFPWYGPGKTPAEIAERVAEICTSAVVDANVSDFHRMDGTITYLLRQVERSIMMAIFPDYRSQLNELLKTDVDNISFMPFGTTYHQGPAQGSGSSATSLFQTLRSTFTAYMAYRHTTKLGSSVTLNAGEAFNALGIHTGDDSLSADLPAKSLKWACTKVGLIVEANIVDRGMRGINFLARYYSDEVWTGSTVSMSDIKRTLSKFHCCLRLPANIKPARKLAEKAFAYSLTDPNTPILGELCKRVLHFCPTSSLELNIHSFWAKYPSEVQYPNENYSGWMHAEIEHALPDFDQSMFRFWLSQCKSIDDILNAPLCVEIAQPTTKLPVIVDNELILPPTGKPPLAKDPEDVIINIDPEPKLVKPKSSVSRKKRTSQVMNVPIPPHYNESTKPSSVRKFELKTKSGTRLVEASSNHKRKVSANTV